MLSGSLHCYVVTSLSQGQCCEGQFAAHAVRRAARAQASPPPRWADDNNIGDNSIITPHRTIYAVVSNSRYL